MVFSSDASNLVSYDSTGACAITACPDLFIHDVETNTTEAIVVGAPGHRSVYSPSISSDGRYTAFASDLAFLAADGGDEGQDFTCGHYTCSIADVFIFNLETFEIKRVSRTFAGTPTDADSDQPFVSSNGRFVAYSSMATNLVPNDTDGVGDIFLYNVDTGQNALVSLADNGAYANARSWSPSVSADGRYVAFISAADNLVAGDENNSCDTNYDGTYNDNCPDVFVRDTLAGRTTRVETPDQLRDGNGNFVHLPYISVDGSHIEFVVPISYDWKTATGYEHPEVITVAIDFEQAVMPPPDTSNVGSSNPPVLAIGGHATITVEDANSTLNRRSGAGINFSIIDRLPYGTIVTIVAGPQSADGYVLVESTNRGWH